MRPLALLALLAMAGCELGSSAVGTWEGTCETSLSGYDVEWDFEVEITEDAGGVLVGEGELEAEGYRYSGPTTGERDGDEVELVTALDVDGYVIQFELVGLIEGDSMTGDCTFGGFTAEFEAER